MPERDKADCMDDLFGVSNILNESSTPAAVSSRSESYTEESVIDEKEFRRALDRFFTQSQNISIADVDVGTRVEPRNSFEKLLEATGMELRIDNDRKISTYLAKRIPHSCFVRNLEKSFVMNEENKNEFLRLFELEIADEEKLHLYLSPSISERGLVGTLFRALLLAKSTQAQVFEILMKKVEYFAKRMDGEKANNVRLALACIAQIRYLDVIYDPKPLFAAIFDLDIEHWRSTARDTLIQALPEILLNVAVQQDAAENLSEMFLKEVDDNSLAFRISIVRTLMILRCDVSTSRKIRRLFIRNIMKVEIIVLPDLVNYCLCTVQRDEKWSYSDILFGLRKYLRLEKLKAPRGDQSKKTVGTIVAEIFEHIAKKARFGFNRFWRESTYALQHDGDMGNGDCEPLDVGDEVMSSAYKNFCVFDILLALSLMSVENCDRGVYSAFKHQISHYRNRVEEFKEDIQTALNFSEFSSRFLKPILAFCEHLMWSLLPNFAHIGSFIMGRLFISVPECRNEILKTMMMHLNDVDCEASAVLGTLELLTECHLADLVSFTAVLHDALRSLIYLSVENVRRLFYVLVTIHMNSSDRMGAQNKAFYNEFTLHVDRLLSSTNRKERTWGVLGMLMQLQAQLRIKDESLDTRECMVEKTLSLLDRRTRGDPQVRALFYAHLTQVIAENPRIPASDAVLEWSDKLQLEFRHIFFEKRKPTYEANRFEDSRYVRSSCKEWLRLGELVSGLENDSGELSQGRIFELIPLFELLRAFARQRQRWEGDDTQKAHEHHWKQFLFAFEANISMKGVDAEASESVKRRFNNDVFCFAIQWIRLMLNTFAECDMAEPGLDDLIKDLMKKKFALMIECQKSLIFTAKKLGEYTLPHLHGYRKEIIVQSQGARKSSKCNSSKKKKLVEKNADKVTDNHEIDEKSGDEDRPAVEVDTDVLDHLENQGEIGNEEKGASDRKRKSDHFRKYIDAGRMLTYFSPFKLLTVTRLIQLLPNKRKQTRFLLESLQKIVKSVLPKKEKKLAPWMMMTETPLGENPINHGDQKAVWRLIHVLLPLVFTILNGAVLYFKSLQDTTAIQDSTQRDCFNDMAQLLNASFFVLKDIFTCKDIAKPETARDEALESERDRRARFERRKCVMEKLERAMIEADVVEDAGGEEDAEVSVLNYFISIAPAVPVLDSSVAILGVLSSIEIFPEEERSRTARIALSYLRREWVDEDGNPLRGCVLNSAVGEILYLYLKLRRSNKRFLAIQWLLAAEISALVPEEERRRSKISSLEECRDDELTEEDSRGHFCCFTKATFPTVYKVLFRSLNETVKSRLALQTVLSGEMSLDECFLQWKRAASCFCLLTLMIRVKDLRNSVVLMCAAREGRLFLYNFVTKSSFMYLLQDEKRFAKFASGANAVFKTIQIGNRSLQNMSVYAKTKKCAALLRMLPELRAVSELFIRTVHSIMVGVDCDEAFQIGLLKSRDLDGEEVKCPDEIVEEEKETEEGSEAAADKPDDEASEEELENEDGDEQTRSSLSPSTISEVY